MRRIDAAAVTGNAVKACLRSTVDESCPVTWLARGETSGRRRCFFCFRTMLVWCLPAIRMASSTVTEGVVETACQPCSVAGPRRPGRVGSTRMAQGTLAGIAGFG